MFINPNLATRLAREHHRQLLAEASQRQLRHQHSRPAATRMIRRLATLIAGAGAMPAPAAGAIWPARPHPLGEPAGRAQIPGRRR